MTVLRELEMSISGAGAKFPTSEKSRAKSDIFANYIFLAGAIDATQV